MSRSHYSDDYGDEFPGQIDLYRANVDRAFYSRAGRAKLAELLAALDAMPVKELADDVFIEKRPAHEARQGAPMCALGVWAATALGDDTARDLFKESEPDSLDTATTLADLGWPKLVVYEVIHENDDPESNHWVTVEGPARKWQPWPVRYLEPETDTQRWQRVRNWVARKLREIAEGDAQVAAWKATHPYTTPSVSGVGLL